MTRSELTVGRVLIAGILALLVPAADADDWPQWLGAQRDGMWRESGILKSFPEGGPAKRWSAPIHGGYAGPAVADGRVFVTDFVRDPNGAGEVAGKTHPNTNYRRGAIAGQERLLCLNEADGKILWIQTRPTTYTHAKLYANGPRTTPLVDGDRVYTLGAEGRLLCVDVATGKKRWSRELKADYKIAAPTWGFATHPIIDGDRLIALVGGEGTAVVAFHKLTGKELWRALSCKNTGYAQLAISKIGAHRQLLAWHGEALSSLQPETGGVNWATPVKPKHEMTIGMPRQEGDLLYIMSWGCSQAFRLQADPLGAKLLWQADKRAGVGGQMNVPWIENGYIYAGDLRGIYRCVELATGKRVWETKGIFGKAKVWIGNVFTIKQGTQFFLCSELGDLIIARLTPKGYEEVDRARIIKQTSVTGGKPIWWSHPAFANRSIYLRNDRAIHCYSLATANE